MLQIPTVKIEQSKIQEVQRVVDDFDYADAQQSFLAFRTLMNQNFLVKGYWFPELMAGRLRQFYDQWKAGKRPIFLLQCPPQHGKSFTVFDFIAWLLGREPDTRVVYTSFSDRLSVRANLRLQRIMDSERYGRVFPGVRLGNKGGGGSGALRNSEILEIVDRDGYFRNSTVGGSITGESLDIGIIDDPIKGHAEANSPLIREKIWDWMTSDLFSRFSEHAAILLVMTRWHVDDPAGRLIEQFGDRVVQIKFPAIAEYEERWRFAGEALFPELKSKEFLEMRRKLYTQASWEALYQQNPIIAGGGVIPIDRLRILPLLEQNKITKSVRYWDKAGTAGGGAFTAGVLMHSMSDGTFVIANVIRGQWSALERERIIAATAAQDFRECPASYDIYVEQEPGSGGKESAQSTIRNLAGYSVYADRVTGSKETRAEPFAAQVQGGNVYLVAGSWVKVFWDEAESWPFGKYKDQVDAAGGAFMKLTSVPSYNIEAAYA